VSLLAAHGSALFGRALFVGQGMSAQLAWFVAACALAFLTAFGFVVVAADVAPNLSAVAWQFAATAALFPFALALTRRYEEADVAFR
jgi:hypothetical protein